MASPLNISATEAREIILRVSRENGWHEPELEATTDPRVLTSIAHLRRQVADSLETIAQDIGSVKGRFILELTQNVEDCSFDLAHSTRWLSFEVDPEKIIVESNQDGFNENDVRQICRTGRSWKRHQRGFVGEKGIGFKAVFQVASRVYIQSNAFSFYFLYRKDGTVEERLGLVTPLLADDPIPARERPLTRMTLFPNNIRYEKLIAHFDQIHPTLLLFLSKIQKISIKVHRQQGGSKIATFRKEVPLEDTSANLTLLIKTDEEADNISGTETEVSRYYIFRTSVTGLSEDEARPGMNGCELVLAFQVNERDHPMTPTQHDVFAYLPVGRFGFNFLIQADFILQASREEINSDSERNNSIISEIAERFCDAVLDFCRRDGPLRYSWVEYLPSGTALQIHHFWGRLRREIIDRLKNKNVLYLHGTSELRKPEDVWTLHSDCLDGNGSPLFRDRPGNHRKYLSLEYGAKNIKTLKELFDINDIQDLAICHRIKYDLRSPDSRIKSGETSDDWHSRAARLITTILGRSRDTDIERMVREDLTLIPLNDGRWVTAAETDVYFPAETGPEIPQDIATTLDPESVVNEAREELFLCLGATEFPPEEVICKIWGKYSTRHGAADIASSKLHLSYLYWHVEDISVPGFSHLWIYDGSERRINTRRTDVPVYLPSADEYGPEALFRGTAPELSVSFLNPEYLNLIFPITRHTRQHGMSWQDWLKQALRVRDVPRLKFSAGSMSTEFRHILQHRPNKIVGTLRTHWATYRPQMTVAITEEIKRAYVSCWGVPSTQLMYTYLPTDGLKNEAANLGIVSRFPFLESNTLQGYTDSPEDWAFLTRFGVQSEANITFYLEVLCQHEIRPQKAWNLARADILNTYSSISGHCSESNKEIVVETFHRGNLILDPSCFQPCSTSLRWIDLDNCVWEGPADILDKTPLHGLSEYRTNRRIARLFHRVLEIQNANWKDYIRSLSKLKTDPNTRRDVAVSARGLYRLFSESGISDGDWDLIRNGFEDGGLIYVPSANEWYPPSRCLWSSPVPIEGMAVIETDYPEGPTDFFLRCLGISPASIETLVQGLCSLAERHASVERIQEMIKEIKRMAPTQRDLVPLTTCNFLPIRRHGSRGNISLGSSQENFAIIDNTKLAAIFRDHVDLLDFSLEDVHELTPFLECLGLQSKYLSRIYTIQTACSGDGMIDERLTREFTDRAYEILRIAVSNRTPRASRPLYDQLLASSILKSDNISTTYTLHHSNGDTIGPIRHSAGHVHIQNQEIGWQIFVPRLKPEREVCYKMHLPQALAKIFEISTSCREHISLVINSSFSILDDLLENIGIGHAPGIEAIPRRVVDDSDEWEDTGGEEEEEEGISVTTPEGTSIVSASQTFGVSQASRAGIAISGGRPRTNISSPQPALEPQPDHISNIPIRGIYSPVDAYTQLLGHVIRIARHKSLAQSDFTAAPGQGQSLPGYDHQAAFGVRTLDQMGHDSKIGAAGELFVYEILRKVLEPHFGEENWRSTIRHLVKVHPNYRVMLPWTGREISDIVYQDIGSHLTRMLIRCGYLDIMWHDCESEYLIEVKTTTGNCADRFFMSTNQYSLMQTNTLQPGHTSDRIYLICRVYDLGKDSMDMKIYIDPEAHRQRNALLFTSSWTVKPRA